MTAADRGALFDPVAGLYSAVFPHVWRRLLPHVGRWVVDRVGPARRVLDAGTGSGYWLGLLAAARTRDRLVGVDLSPAFLGIARERLAATGAELRLADLARTGLPDGGFDAVVCAGVLDTVPDPEAAFAEFHRLLAPGGRLVLVLRGENRAVSRALEVFFRSVVRAVHALKARSWRGTPTAEGQWARRPLLPRVPVLAGRVGLAVVETRRWSLASGVLLERPS
ncbi:class I SAM-dependent methyltransferase [Saccharothrix australiensis]|uniref:Methyltransferase family protein n=1 Tax=Saccharothrix australiensis TaxID=2072 RepID=A0A495W5Q5_9PSEU|nr:class I SAM-dependent methyltransferase [Saccharothrix australiensis]RKT55148.1 methyltransferase family protein [Saccharothrix australiensis]